MNHLDTSTIVAYLRGNQQIANRLHDVIPRAAMSAIVLAELMYGARLSARAKENLQSVVRFAELVPAVPFDEASAATYADLKTALTRLGKPTGEVDALIAATALAHQATLVTCNRRHFENVPGLKVEDWTAG